MSIYFEYEVDKSGRRLRRAVEGDKYDIENILNQSDSSTEALFGDVNVGALIELSVLSICMINEEKKIVGFLSLCDHPNVSGLDPSVWEQWLRNLYQRFYIARNTLFIHFMCCIDSVTEFFLEEALISVFNNDCYLLHIILVVPASCPKDFISRHAVFKRRNFQKHLPRRREDKIGAYLITFMRQDFCPKLKIRRAVEEDNDDLVEILDKRCPRLKDLYGMYYIGEIIGRHPESQRNILVGDIQGRAVSLICINTDINYDKLQTLYELNIFNGLKAATALEKEQNKRANHLLSLFGDPIVKGKCHPFDISPSEPIHKLATVTKHSKIKKSNGKTSTESNKVNFKTDTEEKKLKKRHNIQGLDDISIKNYYSEDYSDKDFYTNSLRALSETTLLSIADILDDDDPFDYDIVNIDENWLTNVESRAKLTQQMPSQTVTLPKKKPKKPELHTKKLKILESASSSYQGGHNAFMIELFALREDIDERHSFEMLEAAFEFMKEYDYCIIQIPSSEKSFPLLEYFCFVPTRPQVTCDYALYVVHRASLLGKFRVRSAELVDIPDIANLLHSLDGKDLLYAVRNIILNYNEENQAYVITNGTSVIGLAILEHPEEIEFMRGRLNLDCYQIHKYHYAGNGIETGFANIKSIIMYPVFEAHYRFFARELMRLSGFNTLMYFTAYRNKLSVNRSNAIIIAMVPLMPRSFQVDSDCVKEVRETGITSNSIVPFSAWFISKKITSIPKVNVTTRIVIIGASRTTQGFLHSLLFGQTSTYLTFTSVTIISPNGIPYQRHVAPLAESMFTQHYNSSDKYLKSIPYSYYVNVIHDKMAEINLQEKFVTLNNGTRYYYDLLFMFFGRQYQYPNYMSHLLKREMEYQNRFSTKYTPLDIPRYSDTEIKLTCDITPDNVFIINHVSEATKALNYIKSHLCKENLKIIVYGSRIHVYLCINALLKINVPAENITFIEPFPSEDRAKTRVSPFCNAYVDKTLCEVLADLKITVIRSYYFQNWIVNSNNVITHANFLSYHNWLRLECSALFYYGRRGIDMNAYVAIHKCGLSYDGGVVIDQDCRTRDPSVYAAGPNTRYPRRFYADSYAHKYYDSYEVGFKLGTKIKNQLDPLFVEPRSEACDTHSSKHVSNNDFENLRLMQLNKPKVTYCVLPGDLKYLEVRSPGRKLPHHYLQSLEYNGYVMETYKKGYFKIHLSKNLFVDGVTCLAPAEFSLEKFKFLYGHSTTVLKNVHIRFSTNKLDDFYEFFRAPWAFFLYHDRTEDLFTMSKELFPKNQPTGLTIKEALSKSLENHAKAHIQDDFKKSSYVEVITDYVIDWLSRNDILLPMYLQPWQCSQFSYDINNHPIIKKNKE